MKYFINIPDPGNRKANRQNLILGEFMLLKICWNENHKAEMQVMIQLQSKKHIHSFIHSFNNCLSSVFKKSFKLIYLAVLGLSCGMREPPPPALECEVLSHWTTREVPIKCILCVGKWLMSNIDRNPALMELAF